MYGIILWSQKSQFWGTLWTNGWHQIFIDMGWGGLLSRGCEDFGCLCIIPLRVCLWFHKGFESMRTRCAFMYDAFSCFKWIYELSHESMCMRWHPDVNDCVENLVFDAQLSPSARSHLNATCIDHVTHKRTFVIQELFNIAIARWRLGCRCVYIYIYINLFFIFYFLFFPFLFFFFLSCSLCVCRKVSSIATCVCASNSLGCWL
jgi:hypothetical protein